ncbi:alkylhydroperoxidase/carboxymuconolactone decarboxylase family protein YurZ [Herbaspirillum sp. Sphag1AN]|uniref:carboxymuconolactone decarboxylase family protein n=1 Tax=unclassified Herbaspirillum TaxID=2624150 RepID=UPI00160E54F5|nr:MULTISPECIES: carboxymuconolactone decarboxylase family protein [unclassified Herbaspirillum]MBB3213506.1 alkylhydroperoxidase/carboxymuconolactone decarboxylase family protein YurZ [Herbaspirillum sp. Sphag1AN]MBB3246704.1 alkylhydroperoxidase/carboxymuconolactone decarboxylase family protein YurZ [Herbaspirillum sp. Sphag64]
MNDDPLDLQQQMLVPMAALTAVGNVSALNGVLQRALDAGLTISAIREALVQLYAYVGFPRSLNALGEFMKVLAERQQRGIVDIAGAEPAPFPDDTDLLAFGTVNQTQLVGVPVKGPLFDFAPAMDQFLKAHLFGAIFGRDNLDWRSRELATVGALSALPGAESQLQAHIAISINIGLTEQQLHQVLPLLAQLVEPSVAQRLRSALMQRQSVA